MKAPYVKKIGKYTVLEEVGSGGFSTVYRCRHEETRAICAVKIGNTSVAGEYREKRRQVDTMAHMEEWAAYGTLKYGRGEAAKHGIPAVYETGLVKMSEREIYPYLVMQLLGRHIGRDLAQPTFTKKRFYEIAQKMLAALQYMHEAGLVHRDVKGLHAREQVQTMRRKVISLVPLTIRVDLPFMGRGKVRMMIWRAWATVCWKCGWGICHGT